MIFHVTHLDPFTLMPGCPGCDQYLDRNNRPSEVLPAGQVWVWMAGATPPHWESRGTGVIVPEELRRKK